MPAVDSSCLSYVDYDQKSKTLQVTFRQSRSDYQYFGVPATVYKRLMQAESKGRFFVNNIRNDYPYARV